MFILCYSRPTFLLIVECMLFAVLGLVFFQTTVYMKMYWCVLRRYIEYCILGQWHRDWRWPSQQKHCMVYGQKCQIQKSSWKWLDSFSLLNYILKSLHSTCTAHFMPSNRWARGIVFLSSSSVCAYIHVPFSALTLLVGRQEGHPACEWWGVGVVIHL